MSPRTLLLAALAAGTYANPAVRRQQPTPTVTGAASPPFTAVTGCHNHGATQYCMFGGDEFQVIADPTVTPQSSYTACHLHSTQTWCMAPGGGEVQITKDGGEAHGGGATSGTPTPAAGATTAPATPKITGLTSCALTESSVTCQTDGTSYVLKTKFTAAAAAPTAVTDCHGHGAEVWCMFGEKEAEIALAGSAAATEPAGDADAGERHCHFHSGVEHCVGPEGENGGEPVQCDKVPRDYNIPVRVGVLFAVLVASAIGVFGPIFLTSFFKLSNNVFLIVLKQFGTGIILSTAFVHLFTHAELMFGNECLGTLEYEATTASIVLAGVFISFLIDYFAHRALHNRAAQVERMGDLNPRDIANVEATNVTVLEAGIIFHSILIGVTLVVAGDSYFGTLAIVIVFHQMFEGIALGTRIADIGKGTSAAAAALLGAHGHSHGPAVLSPAPGAKTDAEAISGNASDNSVQTLNPTATSTISIWKKILMGAVFTIITPIGMGIGIGVLHSFNGNDRNTIIAIGTLDSLSAGILIWFGLVEMLARDWTMGELSPGGVNGKRTIVLVLAMFGLIAGMVLMSFLGKWA